MTCLTVRSTIQPISAPTGTDADMGGNDKRKPSGVNDKISYGGFSYFFLIPDKSGRGSAFYDISAHGMHHRTLRKTQGCGRRAQPPVRLPGTTRLQSVNQRLSCLPIKLSFFFRYL